MFSISRFGELLKALPRGVFHRAVQHTQADRYVKTFSSWDLLMLMLYGQIKQCGSLRTLIDGFNAHESRHYHLHTDIVRRATVSDALAKRSVGPFKRVCEQLTAVIARQQRREMKELLCVIDSTPVTLRSERYPWTGAQRTPTGEGLKVHVTMDLKQQAPTYVNITHMNVNDLSDARDQPIVKGMTYVMDKGYCDYNWWYSIHRAGALLVTRLKYNARYAVKSERDIDAENRDLIRSDQIIHLTNTHPGGGRKNAYAHKDLRRIEVYRPDNNKPLVLVTNDMKRSAKEIADLYKQRWQIELLFKWLKQKLKIKTTFGMSENAIRIQIYCALITYLLMILCRNRYTPGTSLRQFVIELKDTLFESRALDRYYYHVRKQKQQLYNELQQPLFS